MTIWILQVLVSVIFFANKLLVLVGRKSGWALGAVAATLGVFYFYLIHLNIYVALEAGLIILMCYGFIGSKKNPRVDKWIRLMTTTAMLLLAIVAFGGMLTVVELISSSCLLWGTYLLTQGKARQGWFVSVAAHSLAAYLGYERGQQIFLDFQVASAMVSFVGATTKK